MTLAALRCRQCERSHAVRPLAACPACQGPLDAEYAWSGRPRSKRRTRPRPRGRHGSLLSHASEGSEPLSMTPLVGGGRLAAGLGVDLRLKLEGANPTHSFKDRMAASAVAAAETFGLETVCCASTGHLGEAIAARCAVRGLEAVILCPAGETPTWPTAAGGATIVGVRGSFDDCLRLERGLESLFPWGFVEGNLHPFAVEGVKHIAYEVAEQLDGRLPDAVVCPLASGTLFAKLAQGFAELSELGLVEGPRPRLYGGQAGGCGPLASAWADNRPPSRVRPNTLARSLAVGDPVSGELAVGAARISGGGIHAVPEDEIAAATAFLAETTGVLADSAGGVAVGTLLELVGRGAIAEGERVVLVVTGAELGPSSLEQGGGAIEIDPTVEDFLAALGLEERPGSLVA